MIRLAITNRSSTVAPTDFADAVKAVAYQITHHIAPAWGLNVQVLQIPPGGTPPANAWTLDVLDDTDQQDTLGDHELTATGYPTGRVFAHTARSLGLSWTVTLSHEAAEILVDPDVNLSAQINDRAFVGFELADPVEADQYGYTLAVSGRPVLVSDFVLPSWFMPGAHGPFDHTGQLKAPLSLLPGGYASVWTPDKDWHQVQAREDRAPGAPVSRMVMSHRVKRRGSLLGAPTGTNDLRDLL